MHVTCVHGHANIGYGAAHNLVLHGTGADYHLVLNPDVEVATDALACAIRWLDAHPEVGALAPAVRGADGARHYLCKRYPGGLRPVPARLRAARSAARCFAAGSRATRCAISSTPGRRATCSACRRCRAPSCSCGATRSTATGGFDPKFFLYFEDYDWSVRLAGVTTTAYVPSVRVVHYGGGAASKGWRHVDWFVRSVFRFYSKHGWKWV